MTITRNTVVTFIAILAMMLAIGAVGCGGGKSDLAGEESREIQDKKDPKYPDHFLPRPRKIGKRIDKSSPLLSAMPGGGFDQDLPSHRAFEIDGEAVLLPGAPARRGWDGTYKGRGVWSFAMYVVSPPEGAFDSDSSFVQVRVHALDDEGGVDFPSRGRRGNPLFQGGGTQGESPLYTGLANFETNEWDWERHEYRPEGPTTLTRALEANHNTTRSRRCVLVVAVGPADFRDPDDDGDGIDSRFGGFGGAAARGRGGWRTVRGGGLRIHEVSRTSGARLQKRPDLLTSEWDELIDESLEMLSGAPGSVHLAFPTVRDGLHHVRCWDGSCTSSSIPGTVGFSSSTSMAVGPDGLPVVCAVDFRGHVTVLKAADPGGGGDWSSTLAYEGDGDPSRFTTSMCITPEGEEIIAVSDYHDGTDLVLRKRPGRTKYANITLKKGIAPTGSPVCVVDDAGTIFVAFRSSGGEEGGAIHVFRCASGSEKWEPLTLPGVACPIGPDGSPAGVLSGDIGPDGRLDLVCNTPDGDVMFSLTRDGEFHTSRLGSPDTSSSSFSVQSCSEHTHVFAYCPGDGALRVYQKRKFNEEILEQRMCVLPVGQDGVDEDCDGIYGFFGNGIDDDCDGAGEYRCYMLRSSRLTAPGAFSPRCWTLEVRVNRWEAA